MSKRSFTGVEDEASFIPSKGWAEMIRKVYEIDPLICPKCGGTMRIVSFIEDHKVIDRIIKHLKLTFKTTRPPPPPVELYFPDYWPSFHHLFADEQGRLFVMTY